MVDDKIGISQLNKSRNDLANRDDNSMSATALIVILGIPFLLLACRAKFNRGESNDDIGSVNDGDASIPGQDAPQESNASLPNRGEGDSVIADGNASNDESFASGDNSHTDTVSNNNVSISGEDVTQEDSTLLLNTPLVITMRRTGTTSYNAIGLSEIVFYDSTGSVIPVIKESGKVYLREVGESNLLKITPPSCGHYSSSYGFNAAFGSTGYGYLSGTTTQHKDYLAEIIIPTRLASEIQAISALGRSKNSSPGVCGLIKLEWRGRQTVASGGRVRLSFES